jgi:hypothetical protein
MWKAARSAGTNRLRRLVARARATGEMSKPSNRAFRARASHSPIPPVPHPASTSVCPGRIRSRAVISPSRGQSHELAALTSCG